MHFSGMKTRPNEEKQGLLCYATVVKCQDVKRKIQGRTKPDWEAEKVDRVSVLVVTIRLE